ncbi:aspartyl-phosphate phosphatase Spo0E family protein [Oceanobacillus sp. Castelsardo]|nr:aspartyl-phosphate phosphatase Spo0E family protein [Oceanobacillus sp. Castelsardo]
MTKSILLEKIENCRKEMILLSNNQDLTSEAVVSSSMRLDELINLYQKLI